MCTYVNLFIIQSVDYASQKKKFYITITFICFEKPTWVMWQTWVTIVHCSLHGQQNFANLWIHTTTDDVAVINGVTFDLAHIFYWDLQATGRLAQEIKVCWIVLVCYRLWITWIFVSLLTFLRHRGWIMCSAACLKSTVLCWATCKPSLAISVP